MLPDESPRSPGFGFLWIGISRPFLASPVTEPDCCPNTGLTTCFRSCFLGLSVVCWSTSSLLPSLFPATLYCALYPRFRIGQGHRDNKACPHLVPASMAHVIQMAWGPGAGLMGACGVRSSPSCLCPPVPTLGSEATLAAHTLGPLVLSVTVKSLWNLFQLFR